MRATGPFLDLLHVGMLMCDVPTPALVLDHSTATKWNKLSDAALDAALNDNPKSLVDVIYAHTSVLSGRDPQAGAVGLTTVPGVAAGRAAEYVELARLDVTLEQAGGVGSFVGLGLNNHFTGGYYWGRASGPGAAMPAPGVELAFAKGAKPLLSLLRVDNSNDGKRSEWCEFLRKGDQLQIVPQSPSGMLTTGPFDVLVGVRRQGDGVPPGAEPIVVAAWMRSSGLWSRVSLSKVV